MTLDCVKLERAISFMEYLASVVSLIFLPKTLIWNKITFSLSNSLNLVELLVNELTKNIFKKISNIQELITKKRHKFLKNPHHYILLLIMNHQSLSFGGKGSWNKSP